jgi:hypothetical protein
MPSGKTVYVAGPMRHIALFNFPAFDAAAALLRSQGHTVINPAELDRAVGINEHTDPLPPDFLRGAMRRDLDAICGCDAIALLPGWANSKGVGVELALANLLGLEILDATTGEPFHETVLDEAKRLVYGDRAQDYGHPLDECERIGKFWSVILGCEVKPEQVPLCMIAMKISREMNRRKKDNATDVAGYAECLDRIHRERERREAVTASYLPKP